MLKELSKDLAQPLCNFFSFSLDKGVLPSSYKEANVCYIDKKDERSLVNNLVWHAGLLRKLDAAGVTGKLLNWFKNYFLDRRQCVILPGVNSDWSKYLLVLQKVLYWAHYFFLLFSYKRYCKRNWLFYTLIC